LDLSTSTITGYLKGFASFFAQNDEKLRLNHLYQLPSEMRREFDHGAVVQQQTVNYEHSAEGDI
jgi:hypothetical protein